MNKWSEIHKTLLIEKENFKKSFKCINKNIQIKQETVKKHLENLVLALESIRNLTYINFERVTKDHQKEALDIFWQLRDQLVKVLAKYNIQQEVSHSINEKISINIIENPPANLLTKLEAVSSETDCPITNSEIESEEEGEMTQTVVEFLSTAAKLVTEFDGKPENLRSFLDSLKLVEVIKGEHETVAVSLIKTKLKGNARNLIDTETTISEIITKLNRSVKGESVEVLAAKIMSIRQNNKPANSYCNEIEALTKNLENAYITDGLSAELASKYSTQTAVKALTKNCSIEKVKLIMEAGHFNNMNDAISKFIGSCTEATGQQNTILHFGQRPFNGRFARNGRFQRRNNFPRNQNRSNFDNLGNNNQNRNRYRQGRPNFNRNMTHNVRVAQSDENNSEN